MTWMHVNNSNWEIDNASFVIDYVEFEDLKADDLEVWKSTSIKWGDFMITTEGKNRF